MKKRLLFSILPLGLALASCQSGRKNINIYVYDQSDIFLHHMSSELNEKLSSNYSIETLYANKSQLTQNQQIEDGLKTTDLYIMNMVDRLAAGAVVEKCKKKDVPIVFYNREPLLKDLIVYDNCYYVGPNAYEQGKLQVDCAADIFGSPTSLNPEYDLNHDNKIQLIILKGEQGHQDAEQRTQACLSSLIQKGYEIELLSISVCNWSREEAYNYMWSNYSDYVKSAELILANNDEMAIGAANYWKSIIGDEERMIPIIGVDATEEGKKAVDDGLLASTVVNDQTSQVEAIIDLVDILLDNNKKIEDLKYPVKNSKFVYIPSTIYENH